MQDCLNSDSGSQLRLCSYCHPRWAGTEGQDFLANSQDPNIDFAVMHLWVDNWLVRGCKLPLLSC